MQNACGSLGEKKSFGGELLPRLEAQEQIRERGQGLLSPASVRRRDPACGAGDLGARVEHDLL